MTKNDAKNKRKAYEVVHRYFDGKATEQEARKALKDINALIRKMEDEIKKRKQKLTAKGHRLPRL